MSLITVSSVANYYCWDSKWVVSLEIARALTKHLKNASLGSWQHAYIVKPCETAKKRRKSATIYTTGFTTTKFADILTELGYSYETV